MRTQSWYRTYTSGAYRGSGAPADWRMLVARADSVAVAPASSCIPPTVRGRTLLYVAVSPITQTQQRALNHQAVLRCYEVLQATRCSRVAVQLQPRVRDERGR